MKRICLIAMREFRAIIGSPTGLIVVAIYLILSGYVFALEVSVAQEATLRYVFGTLGLFTVFCVPLITMRLLSEELRTGTFEVLTTHPLTDAQIVMGKFLAGWLSFAVLSVPTLSYLVILQFLGSPDWGPALCGYLGQQLLAAMLIALGLLISATTSSQVLAAMGAMVGGILLALAGTASDSIQGWVGQGLAYLAMFEHYGLFRRGVVDTRALIYFVGTTIMFLYLAVRVVESRRWKFGVLPAGMANKWLYPGLSIVLFGGAAVVLVGVFISRITDGMWSWPHAVFAILSVIMIAVPLAINQRRLRYQLARRRVGVIFTVTVNSLMVVAIWALATFMTSRHYVRLDLTSAKTYALSPQTRTILEHLPAPLDLYVAVSHPSPTDLRDEVRDLLSEYAARASRITVHNIDPIKNPGEAERIRETYKLTSPLADEILAVMGDRTRRIPVAALIQQKSALVGGQIVHGPMQFVGEAELTSAIIQLTRKTPGRVAFLAGQGEREITDSSNRGISTVVRELHRNGWAVDSHVVTPGVNADFPTDTVVAVVAGPQKALSNEDLKALDDLLNKGGGVLLLLDPGVTTGAEPLMNPWDVRITDDMVVDFQEHLATADPTALYVTHFTQEHPIGKGMGSLAAVLPTARRVATNVKEPNPHVFTHSFMHTSGNGWSVLRKPGEKEMRIDRQHDKRGPISLGVACERTQPSPDPGHAPLQGRLVVIGDSDFVSNQYVDMAGNLNLTLNCVDWLAGRQDLIAVRPKVVEARLMSLTRNQTQAVFWVSAVVVPGVFVLIGVATLVRRRRKA